MFKRFYSLLLFFGFNPLILFNNLRGINWYLRDYILFKNLSRENLDFEKINFYPILNEKFATSGIAKGHYFNQDLLIAQRIFLNKPIHHIDIGSRIDGFVAHLASFRSVEVFDIRPLGNTIKNVNFRQADMMQLDKSLYDYTDSISCLHTIEHFGLGRYNDSINPNGYLKGLDNITLALRTGGIFYFSTPIGPQRIEFNAHRIFSLSYLFKLFSRDYKIVQFSYVDDLGDLHENVTISTELVQNNYGCHHGCGIFEMIKK